MAVKPANSKYHTFTFNGVRAADYGIYVTDVNVFNSAARDVDYIEIPGRDGAFALDRGRFQNISVVYKCAMTQDTDEDFATAISEFRNAIASTKGYKRLEDDIHTDEYRMGVFSKGLEAPTLNTKTATFDVEFNCQPQRWLKSGEIPRTIGGQVTNTQTTSGAVVALDSDGVDKVTSLVAQITPKQAGSGDPSPTNVRPITGWTGVNVSVTGINVWDEEWSAYSANQIRSNNTIKIKPNTQYYLVAPVVVGLYFVDANGASAGTQYKRNAVFTTPANAVGVNLITTNYGGNVYNYDISINYPSTDHDYHQYTGHAYTVSFGSAGTVYGGTVDVVTGVLTVTHASVNIGNLTWSYNNANGKYFSTSISGKKAGSFNLMSSAFKTGTNAYISNLLNGGIIGNGSNTNVYAKDERYTTAQAFVTEHANHTIVYELATPQTYNLTAQEVELLTGNNNVWADTGDITLTYGRDPNKIVNQTLFESHPLLHLWGYGTVNMLADDQDSQIVINNDPYGSVLLTNKVAKPSSQVSEFLNKSATELLNINDAVQVSAGSVMSIPFDSRVGTDINITNVSVSKTSTYDMDMSYVTARYGTYFIITFTLQQIDFVFSQTDQFKNSDVNVTVSYTQGGVSKTSSFPVRVHAQSTYSRTRDNISVGLFASIRTDGNDFFINGAKPISSTMQTIYGISTKGPFSNNEDSYIDLDIGEAYREVSGQTVSVNNAVTIPAQLPTLKCGANTITYDSTITQFKIVPRWWKV